MRIVVIGGTGHIGTFLIPRLVEAGHEVVSVSRGARAPYRSSPAWGAVRQVVTDRSRAEEDGTFGSSIAALAPDVIIDLICFELSSARHLVEAVRDQIGLFVHCGTLWVHGVPASRPYDETATREPFGEYGIRKAEIERYLLEEASTGFPATILHPGHITGPGWNPINPAGNLDMAVFDRLFAGQRVALPDDGESTLQHVHADDVAQAFALAVERPAAAIGEAFHVAARAPVTLRAYADAVASWADVAADLEFLPWDEWQSGQSDQNASLTRDHMLHSPHASIAKAERVLGYNPRFDAVSAVRDALGR